MSDDRCWICLGYDGDLPPLASPSESRELITACGCSLKVHQKCLLDWSTSTALQSRENGFELRRNDNPTFIVRDQTGSHMVSVKPTSGLRIFTNDELKCPQCRTPFMLTCEPSTLLRFTNILKTAGKNVTYYTLLSSVGSALAGSIIVTGFSLLTSLGFKLLQRIAPTSVIMKLLNLSDKNLDTALRNNKIGFKHLSLISGFPLFLLSCRGDGHVSAVFRNGYPLLFFNNVWKFNSKDPRNFLLCVEPIHELYNLLFKGTFNRFHYRLIRGINTCFLGNELPLDEIEEVEKENQEFAELELERVEKNSSANLSWIKRLQYFLVPNYSTKVKEILKKRREREIRLVSKHDYSKALSSKSTLLKFLTTFLWPVAGEIIGKLLIKSPWIRDVVNRCVSTPDEARYLVNLLGCCIAVLGKDLVNLYLTWKYCKQYQNINFLDTRFKGFDVVKVPAPESDGNHTNGELANREEEEEIGLNIPGMWVRGDPFVNNEAGIEEVAGRGGEVNGIAIDLNYNRFLTDLFDGFNRRFPGIG